MNIAIIGAGYAGLSVCWHLLQTSGIKTTIFESVGIGGGASGVSTGLLHPYPAKNTRQSHRADVAMVEATRLIDVAEHALQRPVALRTGILRLASSPEQQKAFLRCADDAEIWEEARILSLLPHAKSSKGLWIPQGKTVFSRLYLDGLWRACKKNGARWVSQEIFQLAQLDEYDHIVLANGHGVMRFPECRHLPLKVRKGQALLCRWPLDLEPLPCSLVGRGHLSLSEEPAQCFLGSTYEDECDLAAAYALREKIGSFFPPALSFEVVEVYSGTRIAPKIGYLPLVEQVNSKIWVFTGLGSRGLLYHGLYGKELAEKIFTTEVGKK